MAERGTFARITREATLKGVDVVLGAELSDGANIEGVAGNPVVAYFGPDLNDPAVRRRVCQWRHAGFKVLAFAFSRNAETASASAEFVNLGRVMPQSRVGRVVPLALAALRIVTQRRILTDVDLFIGRNLDNILLALFARCIVSSDAPVVYEVFDINPSCTEPGHRAALIRWLEKRLLAHINLLVVSSPHFLMAYYEQVLHYVGGWFLFENKIPRCARVRLERLAAAKPGAVPTETTAPGMRPWRIGWFGYLDDEKSWNILRRLAQRLAGQVTVYVRGMPYTNFNMAQFLVDVQRLDNVTYGGVYRNPEDLAEIYDAVDMVWSADCNYPAANSKWLLTNGLYEAGYFCKPVIGLVGTAVGQFLAMRQSGWCLSEPVYESFVELIQNLTVEEYDAKRKMIAELSLDVFVESDEIRRIWRTLQRQKPRQEKSGAAPVEKV